MSGYDPLNAKPRDATRVTSDRVETLEVKEREAGMRLDRWLRLYFPDVTQSYLQKLLRSGQVRVESKRVEANARLEPGQKVRVPKIVRAPDRPRAEGDEDAHPKTPPQDRALIESMILYEDEDVMVLNKPFGLAVQGGTGTKRHIDGMLAGMADRFGDRPRLVHRLDRDTTGILLVAKHRQAAAKLGRIFQTRSAAKTYWALLKGVPHPLQGKVEVPLVKASGPDGDRMRKARPGEQKEAMHATTHYSVIDRAGHTASWVSLKPVTGRQHQLRAHMELIGTPIVGDPKYGHEKIMHMAENIEPKLHLHSRRLIIPHPAEPNRKIDVTAPLPAHMLTTWELLGMNPKRYDENEG